MQKYAVSILRYRGTRAGNDVTRGQVVRVMAELEDAACDIVREKYSTKPPPWYPGVQVNWVKLAAEWDRVFSE